MNAFETIRHAAAKLIPDKLRRRPLGLSREQWERLSPQMRGHILSERSMDAEPKPQSIKPVDAPPS